MPKCIHVCFISKRRRKLSWVFSGWKDLWKLFESSESRYDWSPTSPILLHESWFPEFLRVGKLCFYELPWTSKLRLMDRRIPPQSKILWVSVGFSCRNQFSLVVKSKNLLSRSSDQKEDYFAHNFRSSYFSTLLSTYLFDCCHRKVFRVETRFSNICLLCVLDISYSPCFCTFPLLLLIVFIIVNNHWGRQHSFLSKFCHPPWLGTVHIWRRHRGNTNRCTRTTGELYYYCFLCGS